MQERGFSVDDMMKTLASIAVGSAHPPVIEIDPECGCAYLRFKPAAKVARTKVIGTSDRVSTTVDYDARNEVVGIELIGVKEFSVHAIRSMLPRSARNLDLERARFVLAPSREAVAR